MSFSVRDYQARCWAYGIDAGPIDGIMGSKTRNGINKLMKLKGVDRKEDVFHHSGLHRIHMHWTAGAYGDIELEREAYHVIILEDGDVVMGRHKPEANRSTSDGQYAAHTRAANSGSIGISVDCMAGAKEAPFDPGYAPMTVVQLESMCREVANLAETYDIPISRYSTLTHSEVQPTLGIRQNWKWDINWIPGMAKPGDPIRVGDVIRNKIRKYQNDNTVQNSVNKKSQPFTIKVEQQSKSKLWEIFTNWNNWFGRV